MLRLLRLDRSRSSFGAGSIGAVLAGIAAILALGFSIRGRGGRMLLLVTAAAAIFLAISIVAAQV